jgi:hypothetical protein
MVFILAIDLLQRILSMATRHGILSPICSRSIQCRISLYADDAGIFVNPVKQELTAIAAILDVFEKASGLITTIGSRGAASRRGHVGNTLGVWLKEH